MYFIPANSSLYRSWRERPYELWAQRDHLRTRVLFLELHIQQLAIGWILSVVEVDEILKCDISGEHSRALTIVSVPEVEQKSRTTMDNSHFWSSSGQAVNECFPCTR